MGGEACDRICGHYAAGEPATAIAADYYIETGNDFVDLQHTETKTDRELVAATAQRLFAFRKQRSWAAAEL